MTPSLLALLLSATLLGAPPPPAPPAPAPKCPRNPEAPAHAAKKTYHRLVEEYTDALPGPDGEAIRERKVEDIIAESLDVRRFAVETLKRFWDKSSPEQQQRWTITLGAMLHRKYRDRLKEPQRHRLTIGKVTLQCHDALVEGKLVPLVKRRPDDGTDIMLRMGFGPAGWRVYDVKVDETSLLAIWRSRFRRIYKDGGIPAVDDQMKKLAKRYPCKSLACRRFAQP